MSEAVSMLIKPRKSVRFFDGIKEDPEKVISSSPQNYLTEQPPEKEPTTKGEITNIIVISPSGECVEETQVQLNIPKEQFLEHLLEVDEIENGHATKPEIVSDDEETELQKDNKLYKGTSFITTRNYFNERGIVIAPVASHEQKVFTVRRKLPSEQDKNSSASPYIITCVSDELKQSETEKPTAASSSHDSVSSKPSTNANKMSYTISGFASPSTRLQEKEELKQLNDRFTLYVQRVRQLGEQANQVDSTAFIKTTKILEQEIHNLKNLYEQELQKLRNEVDNMTQEKTTYQLQSAKHQQNCVELQDRVSTEIDRNRKLLDDLNVLQRKMYQLESELHNAKLSNKDDSPNINQLQRKVENLSREHETLLKKYEFEQLTRQQAEDRIQQLMKKNEFNDQVHSQQIKDLGDRNEASVTTILCLESKIRELGTNDTSIADMMAQVREAAESELSKYKLETEAQHSRDMSSIKSQMNADYSTIQRLQDENVKLQGCIGDLNTKIRNLHGQVTSLESQRQSFDDAVKSDRQQAAENVNNLETKLHQVQELLFDKIQEVSSSRESNVPLKAEIEGLKVLLEAEERRLKLSPSSPAKSHQSVPVTYESSMSLPTRTTASPVKTTLAGLPTTPTFPCKQHTEIGGEFSSNFPSKQQMEYSSNYPTKQPAEYSSIYPTKQHAEYSSGDPSKKHAEYSSIYPAKQPCESFTYITDPYFTPPFALPPATENTRLDAPFDPYSYGQQNTIPMGTSFEHDFPMTYTPVFLDCDELNPEAGHLPYGKTRHLYMDRTPSMDRVLTDRTPGDSPRDSETAINAYHTGVLRSKSAPVHPSPRDRYIHLIPTSLGQGKDYFDEMFNDLQRETLLTSIRPKSTPLERIYSSSSQDYAVATNSAIGDVKILEVNTDGKFVRLFNDGSQEIEFGNFMIQQNVGGHPVAVFRFPPQTKFMGNSTITVHSGMNDLILHQPPTDFVWKEQQKWGTGPECTTILCRPNGQAIAWTTAAHRFTRNLCEEYPKERQVGVTDEDSLLGEDESLKEMNIERTTQTEPVYLKREKQQRLTLTPSRHPHGMPVTTPTHPHTGQPRPRALGNDNSSHSRQSRSQTTRPDPIPGQPYAGAPAQRMGSAPLRKYAAAQNATLKGNGSLANKAAGTIRFGPPSPFLSPLQQEFSQADRNRSTSLVRFTS